MQANQKKTTKDDQNELGYFDDEEGQSDCEEFDKAQQP